MHLHVAAAHRDMDTVHYLINSPNAPGVQLLNRASGMMDSPAMILGREAYWTAALQVKVTSEVFQHNKRRIIYLV